jgi:hypothetical protein
MLPDACEAKSALTDYIDQLALSYVAARLGRRSWSGITLASIILVLGNILLYTALAIGGWWNLVWPIAVFLLILGAFGLSESLTRKERGDESKRHETPSSAVSAAENEVTSPQNSAEEHSTGAASGD